MSSEKHTKPAAELTYLQRLVVLMFFTHTARGFFSAFYRAL